MIESAVFLNFFGGLKKPFPPLGAHLAHKAKKSGRYPDYGRRPSAISLSMIAVDYFGFVSSGDLIVYMQVLTKWANLIKEYYTEIEAKCFGKENEDIDTSKS